MDASAAQDHGPLSCSVCGRSSILRHAFTQGRDGTLKRTWCPLCFSRHQNRANNAALICVIVVLALTPFVMHRVPHDPVLGFMILSFAAWFGPAIMVLPHELGHAIVGRCVGFAPVSIVVGEGRLLFDRVMLGVRLRIGRGLRGGATYLDVHEVPNFKARMIAVLAAGPAVNLIAGIVAIAIARDVDDLSPALRAASIGFGIGNILHALFGLWPRTARTPAGKVASDGAQILAQILNVPMDLRLRRAVIHLIRAMYAYHDRDFDAAKRETAAAESLSEHLELRSEVIALRAESFSESGDPRGALELLAPMRARDDLTDEMRSRLDQAYAWAVLLADESVLAEDALAQIARCAELLPWSEVVLIKHICLLASSAAANPERPNSERLTEARWRLDQLRGFPLEGESRGYAALARGLVAAAEKNPERARTEYNAAKNASVSATALGLLERRRKSLNIIEAQ